MRIIGIDENGLGPQLGPMVVTAVAFDSSGYDPELFWRVAREHLPADDSKKIFSRARLKPAELATLRWLDVFGSTPSTPADLEARICLSAPVALPCGKNRPRHCHPSPTRLPLWADHFHAGEASESRAALAAAGLTPVAARAFSICPGAFNVATAEPEMNKLRFDFYLMMLLARDLAAGDTDDTLILCGKVGSTRRYGAWFSGADLDAWWNERELPEASTYRVREIGRVSFIRDADSLHLPVAVASMIGKYLRELAMYDLNQLLAEPGARPASGYRDPVTSGFIAATAEKRAQLGLEDTCFRRNT